LISKLGKLKLVRDLHDDLQIWTSGPLPEHWTIYSLNYFTLSRLVLMGLCICMSCGPMIRPLIHMRLKPISE